MQRADEAQGDDTMLKVFGDLYMNPNSGYYPGSVDEFKRVVARLTTAFRSTRATVSSRRRF
jgi:hypothetical protein